MITTPTAFAPLSHPLTNDPDTGATETEYEDNLNLQFNYTATDGDGDTVTGTITINVDDDTPDPVCDQFEVTEGGAGTRQHRPDPRPLRQHGGPTTSMASPASRIGEVRLDQSAQQRQRQSGDDRRIR